MSKINKREGAIWSCIFIKEWRMKKTNAKRVKQARSLYLWKSSCHKASNPHGNVAIRTTIRQGLMKLTSGCIKLTDKATNGWLTNRKENLLSDANISYMLQGLTCLIKSAPIFSSITV